MALSEKPVPLGNFQYGKEYLLYKDLRTRKTSLVDVNGSTLVFAEEAGDPVPAGYDKDPQPAGFDKDPYPAGWDRNPCVYFTYFDPETRMTYAMERRSGRLENLKIEAKLNDRDWTDFQLCPDSDLYYGFEDSLDKAEARRK